MKKLLPIIFLYLISCSKDNDQQTSNLDLLTSGKWIPESIVYNPPYDFLSNGTLVSDAYPLYDPCDKDNFLEFVLPATTKFDEGPTKCFPASPQIEYGSWKLINNDKQVEVSDSFETVTFSFVGNKLVGSTSFPDFDSTNGGKDYIITATLILK